MYILPDSVHTSTVSVSKSLAVTLNIQYCLHSAFVRSGHLPRSSLDFGLTNGGAHGALTVVLQCALASNLSLGLAASENAPRSRPSGERQGGSTGVSPA